MHAGPDRDLPLQLPQAQIHLATQPDIVNALAPQDLHDICLEHHLFDFGALIHGRQWCMIGKCRKRQDCVEGMLDCPCV